jgi:hypothetical protein
MGVLLGLSCHAASIDRVLQETTAGEDDLAIDVLSP